MDDWQHKVGDTGAMPEKQLLLNMWPNGIQPITDKPEVSYAGDLLQLSCTTAGASIAYIISDHEVKPDFDSGWQLYSKPLVKEKGKKIYVQAHRIGYKESEVLKLEL